jgi:hypothetical protein
MEKTMSEPIAVHIDIPRVKKNARLLEKWVGLQTSTSQELTARMMSATSWQNLLTLGVFVPDDSLRGAGNLGVFKRIHEQADLLAGRLNIPASTATKLAAFWQPTARRRSPEVLFSFLEDIKALPSDTSLPASWLNHAPSAKELLKLAADCPALAQDQVDEPIKQRPEAFFSIVRDGLAFHGMADSELYLRVDRLGKRPSMSDYLGYVSFGPGSIEPDGNGGFMLAKYTTQARAKLVGLTEQSAREVAHSFGFSAPGGLGGFLGHSGFYGSRAALGLASWIARHPRKASKLSSAANLYMGAWPENTMVRLEFELVHAGLLV